MKMTPAKCFAELTSHLRSLRMLDDLNQRQFAVNAGRGHSLTKIQLHILTEANFFAAFRSYEQFLRNIFLLYCCGVQPNRRKFIRSYLNPQTLKHAEELIQSSMPFLDWNSPDSLIQRAETYLKNGYPIKDIISANIEPLRDLRRIRNHIAHMSKESYSEYLKTVRQHYGTVPMKVPRPGEYLLLTKVGTPSYYLNYYFDLIDSVGSKLI